MYKYYIVTDAICNRTTSCCRMHNDSQQIFTMLRTTTMMIIHSFLNSALLLLPNRYIRASHHFYPKKGEILIRNSTSATLAEKWEILIVNTSSPPRKVRNINWKLYNCYPCWKVRNINWKPSLHLPEEWEILIGNLGPLLPLLKSVKYYLIPCNWWLIFSKHMWMGIQKNCTYHDHLALLDPCCALHVFLSNFI